MITINFLIFNLTYKDIQNLFNFSNINIILLKFILKILRNLYNLYIYILNSLN